MTFHAEGVFYQGWLQHTVTHILCEKIILHEP